MPFGVDAGEDAAGEITPHGHEVDLWHLATSGSLQRVADLGEMLVFGRLVDRQVVVSIAEMGGLARFLPRTC